MVLADVVGFGFVVGIDGVVIGFTIFFSVTDC